MTAAYSATHTATDSSGTGNRSITFTPAVGDLIVLYVHLNTNSNTTMTCSDNQSGTYHRVGTAENDNAGNRIIGVFVREQLIASASATTATVASGSNTGGAIIVDRFSGMTLAGASAVRSSGKEEHLGTVTPAPVLNQSALTANIVLGVVGSTNDPATMTPPTSWTESADIGESDVNGACGLESVYRNSGFTGTTVTWGSTFGGANTGCSYALELDTTAIPLNAVLSKTLGAVTCSATAKAVVQGSVSQTLGAITCSATTKVVVKAAVAVTLGAITCSGRIADHVEANVSITLDSITADFRCQRVNKYTYPVNSRRDERPELGEFDLSLN